MGFRFQSNVIYLAAPVVRCGIQAGESVFGMDSACMAIAVNPRAASRIGEVMKPMNAQINPSIPHKNCRLNNATMPVMTARGTKTGAI